MIKSRLKIITLFASIILVSFSSCSYNHSNATYNEIDSLNRVSYDLHYKDLYASSLAASKAYKLSEKYPSLRAEALNNLAFTAFMRMDFEKAKTFLSKVYSISNNELEALIADINMMKIYQRTAQYKEFYDYRNSALRRLKRIDDDISSLTTERELERLNYAKSELAITSSTYYYYLQQDKQALQAINDIDVENTLAKDTAQLLYYYYMKGSGGLYEANTHKDVVIGEFDYLLKCLEISHEQGYKYFEANAAQAVAELFTNKNNFDILTQSRPGALRLVNKDNLPWDSLTLGFGNRALSLFKSYGDWYQTAGTHRTLASFYNETKQYDKALDNLKQALDYVNRHHQRYYKNKDSLDILKTFVPTDTISREIRWINNRNVATVPEWIARIREQLSVTYAALGLKPQSDYNRNIYLDILDYTRQDKELEGRYNNLQRESQLLSALLGLVIIGIVFSIFLFWILNKRWRKRNIIYINKLKSTIEICQKVTASVSPDAVDIDEVISSITDTVGEKIEKLIGCDRFQIIDKDNEDDGSSNEKLFISFPLYSTDNSDIIGHVRLFYTKKIKNEEKSLIKVILPYISWTLENGNTLISLGDERKRFEKEQYIHQQHIIEDKRQNIIKKACLFVVTGITPYLDRIINEVNKLTSPALKLDEKIKEEKVKYIDELITRINEYNDIIAIWIKMRRGSLSLNIENFELQSIFDTISKGRKNFEMKGQSLSVTPTTSVIKADKALTLFMVNTLAENARKYTPEGGNIDIYADENNDYIEISVKDNGPGLSEDDINRILNDKVYDSSEIGINDSDNPEELKKNKGNGFGLINCKGIIEKYKKTNELFKVCTFSIDSEKGKGSRFFFRLPKGIIRTLSILLFIICLGACDHVKSNIEKGDRSIDTTSYDSLLAVANDYANQVYQSNVNGDYASAINYADSAIHNLNAHYIRYSGKKSPLLSLTQQRSISEAKWFYDKFDTDYYTILDIRNEAAVAYLALGDINNYKYNNSIYTSLYKKISRDVTLEQYCRKMERSANNMTIAIIICIVLLIVLFVGYYIIYFRHRLLYRFNLEQVLEISNKIYTSPLSQTSNNEKIAGQLIDETYHSINELIQISSLAIGIYNEEKKRLEFSFSSSTDEDEMKSIMQNRFENCNDNHKNDGEIKCYPLWIEIGETRNCIGIVSIKSSERYNEDIELMLEIIAGYIAVVIYNAVVIMGQKHRDIETAQDDARRSVREENQLHIQNMVLDNCLSTIKHETIYYPNKIKQIVGKISNDEICSHNSDEQIETIKELVSYYKDIFTLLTSCASRQLEDVTFRRGKISIGDLAKYAEKYFKRVSSKRMIEAKLTVKTEPLTISADIIELKFMIENLINYALDNEKEGNLELNIYKESRFIRFDFTDRREEKSSEELNALFYPNLSIMQNEESDELKGVELLICKQIIRDHDEYSGYRGCRINASQATDGGYTIWFTLPL